VTIVVSRWEEHDLLVPGERYLHRPSGEVWIFGNETTPGEAAVARTAVDLADEVHALVFHVEDGGVRIMTPDSFSPPDGAVPQSLELLARR
jgi:hypothetical protein